MPIMHPKQDNESGLEAERNIAQFQNDNVPNSKILAGTYDMLLLSLAFLLSLQPGAVLD